MAIVVCRSVRHEISDVSSLKLQVISPLCGNLQALWRLGGAKDGRTAIPNSTTYRAVHLRRR